MAEFFSKEPLPLNASGKEKEKAPTGFRAAKIIVGRACEIHGQSVFTYHEIKTMTGLEPSAEFFDYLRTRYEVTDYGDRIVLSKKVKPAFQFGSKGQVTGRKAKKV